MNNPTKKIIYYYQEFIPLDNLISANLRNVHIYISSVHFGKDKDGNLYLSINDNPPDDQPHLWENVKMAADNNIKIMIMLGGAGGAYTTLFQYYEECYALLYKLLKSHTIIGGIDLDIEELVSLDNAKKLIKRIKDDFGKDFIVTMAPISYSMDTDNPGMGGFSYKQLVETEEGKMIDWFNVQCYGNASFDTYNNIIKNGYTSDMIALGMLGDNYTEETFSTTLDEINKITIKYPKMCGVVLWEFADTKINPVLWGKFINYVFNFN